MWRFTPWAAATFALLAVCGSSRAQPPKVFERIDEARESLRGLALYPRDVREAILEIAQYPDLVTKLAALKTLDSKSVDPVLAAYPAAARQPARLLVQYPEVLQPMAQHPAITAVVGKVYGLRKDEFKKLLDTQEQANSKSVEAWSQRLADNPEAMEQLIAAVREFAKQASQAAAPPSESSTTSSSTSEPYYYFYGGFYTTPTAAAVYAVPTGELATYVLANADEYAALADEVVDQWLHADSADDFEQAMSNWWSQHESAFPESLLDGDGSRSERLSELARLEKRHPTRGGQASDAARQKTLRDSPAEFPNLSRTTGTAKSKSPAQATPGKPPAKPTGASAKKTTPSKTAPKVEHRAPSQKQQVARASANHKGSWGQSAKTPSRGGSKPKKPAPSGGAKKKR
jgi:hypothetical protein